LNELNSWKSFDEFLIDSETTRDVPLVDSQRYVSYSYEDLFPEWHTQAHCAGVGQKYYFGEDESENKQPTMSIQQVRRAAKLCDVCPVYTDCLRWSLEKREAYGVWAGTSGRVRRKIFAVLDAGLATVDDVIERYLNGQGDYYRQLVIDRDSDDGGDRHAPSTDGLRAESAG
jgi:hypothetical protein